MGNKCLTKREKGWALPASSFALSTPLNLAYAANNKKSSQKTVLK